jgi:hypothetical protein
MGGIGQGECFCIVRSTTNLLIELNTRFIPREHTPLQPPTRHLKHLLGKVLEQFDHYPAAYRGDPEPDPRWHGSVLLQLLNLAICPW